MYLLVFITLVISLIGIYAQVLSLQASRMAQGQTVIAQTMLAWHATAVAQARYGGISPLPGAGGCDLTGGGPVGTACSNPGLGPVNVQLTVPGGGWVACSGTPAPPCWATLPSGYTTPPYEFYSVYYLPAGAGQNYYVVTFVPPPVPGAANPPPGFIALPDGALGSPHIGITMGELLGQLKNSGLPPLSYGTVSGGKLVTPAISGGTGTATTSPQYTLPAVVPNGSIAVISLRS